MDGLQIDRKTAELERENKQLLYKIELMKKTVVRLKQERRYLFEKLREKHGEQLKLPTMEAGEMDCSDYEQIKNIESIPVDTHLERINDAEVVAIVSSSQPTREEREEKPLLDYAEFVKTETPLLKASHPTLDGNEVELVLLGRWKRLHSRCD